MINESDIQEFINDALFDKKKFRSNFKKYKKQFEENNEDLMILLDIILSSIIQEENKIEPEIKLSAMRFVKEAIELKNMKLIEIMKKNTLLALKKIAKFRSFDTDDDRGKYFFGSNKGEEIEKIGATLLIMCLECIKVWALWFKEEYLEVYFELIQENIKFPEELNYFKLNENEMNEINQLKNLINSNRNENENEDENNITSMEIELIESNENQIKILEKEIKEKNEKTLNQNNVKIIMDLNEYFNKYYPKTKAKLLNLKQNQSMNDNLIKLEKIKKYFDSLIILYNSYQQKEINYQQFKNSFIKLSLNEKEFDPKVKFVKDELFVSMEMYKKNKLSYLDKIRQNEIETIDLIIKTSLFVLQNEKKPLIKILSLKFLKDTMDLRNEKMTDAIERECLEIILQIALFKYEIQDLERGAFYFSENPSEELQKQGQTFFLLSIECIMNWGIWYKERKSTNKMTYLKANQEFSKKVKILPDVMMYFLDISYINSKNSEMESFLRTFKETINETENYISEGKKIYDSIKINEIKTKVSSLNLFDYEKKSIDKFFDLYEELTEIITDFTSVKNNKIKINEFIEKYKKKYYIKTQKKGIVELINESMNNEEIFNNNKNLLEEEILNSESSQINEIIFNLTKIYENEPKNYLKIYLSLNIINLLWCSSNPMIKMNPMNIQVFNIAIKKTQDSKEINKYFDLATEFAFEMIIYYGNDNNTILKDYYNKLINSDIDLDSKFLFFEPPKFYKNIINERNKEKLEKNIKEYIMNTKEIEKKLTDSFNTIINEFDFDANIFLDIIELINRNEHNFIKSTDPQLLNEYYDELKEDFLKNQKFNHQFLNEIPLFLDNFTYYEKYRLTYLEKNAPHLLRKNSKKYSLSKPPFQDQLKIEELDPPLSSSVQTGDFNISPKNLAELPSIEETNNINIIPTSTHPDRTKRKKSSFFKDKALNSRGSFFSNSDLKLSSINEYPKENEISSFKESINDPKDIFMKSFKAIIEKKEELNREEKINTRNSSLRRTTSNFGATEFLSAVVPSLKRKKDLLNISNIADDSEEKLRLKQENNILKEKINELSHNHEELMNDYNYMLEDKEKLSKDNTNIKEDLISIRKKYEYLMEENPEKLKSIQQDLINKYNKLFEDHKQLSENHKKILYDNENLKKIPIIPRISSTHDLDEFLNDQLQGKHKNIMYELNCLKSENEKLNSDNEELIYSIRKSGTLKYDNETSNEDKKNASISALVYTFDDEKDEVVNNNYEQKNDKNVQTYQSNLIKSSPDVKKRLIFQINNKTPPKIFDPLKNYNEEKLEESYNKNSWKEFESKFNSQVKNKENSITLLQYLNKQKEKNNKKTSLKKLESPSRPEMEKKISEKKIKKKNIINKEENNENLGFFLFSERNYRGKIIDIDYNLFNNISDFSKLMINKFKLGCLKNKANLFENDNIQIGCIINLGNENKNNLLMIKLYFYNKCNEIIKNCKIEFVGDASLNLWTKPDKIKEIIKPKEQIKQELIIDFVEIPYTCLRAEYHYCLSKEKKFIHLAIPTTINKFFQWNKISANTFRRKWKQKNDEDKIRSKILPLNTKIVKSLENIKYFFDCLVDLKPNQELDFLKNKKHYSLGGSFLIGQTNKNFLLKLILLPNNNIIIKIARENNMYEDILSIEEYIIYSLSFILCKVEKEMRINDLL